ncbi:MAG: ABC-F family ATP-binding cassette domain-containing protein, partial [Eggerthellaceae bacterium]|nr:ABC-F family ATP-binding cassette domain-containing protein [Eggerthellaceae bacterium]
RDILAGLLADVSLNAEVGTLSGGQRRRVDLARVLIGTWDVLMLDEPTNHLDIRGITWLANHLKTRWKAGAGALLVVTHDRWFLDEVATSMWEVHHGRVEPFEGGFSAYIMQRVERERLANLAEAKRQNLLRRELAWLSRGARARATKPKFHVAAARALIADVPPLRDTTELHRMAVARLGKQVVDLEQVTVAFDGEPVLKNISWQIGAGDRYGIVGENGAGKTTLLRVIRGEQEPTRGRVKIGASVRFGVLSQRLEMLDEFGADRVRTVIGRFGRRTMVDGREMTPAQMLEQLGFSAGDLNEPVCDLSGGQKRRFALVLVLLEEPNVLILDEPGNDLDVDMLAAVETMLDGWPGTLIIVTHDRYLMERVADDIYALMDGELKHLPGGIDEYLRMGPTSTAVSGQAFAAAATASATQPAGGAPDETPGEGGNQALSGGEIRRLRKAMESAERKLETARTRLAKAEEALAAADPSDYLELGRRQAAIDEARSQMEELELEWLEAAEALGE